MSGVYHSPRWPTARQMVARLAGPALALVAGALMACAGTGAPGGAGPSRVDHPGSSAAGAGLHAGVEVSAYGDETLEVVVSAYNEGPGPLTIDPQGALLAFDGLEYGPQGEQAPIQIPPDQGRRIELRYRTGRRLGQDAVVVLRAVQRGERWLEPLRLVVPAAPPRPVPGQVGSAP